MGLAATDTAGGRELRLEATRFLDAQRRRGAHVYRVEEQAPGIYWLIYAAEGVARRAIVAGARPKGWRLIDDEQGWPV
jgi:hypothetical protein